MDSEELEQEQVAAFEADLFDASDVDFEFKQSKDMKTVYLIAKSKKPFNLLKYYLALKGYVETMESEIGIFEAPPDVQ